MIGHTILLLGTIVTFRYSAIVIVIKCMGYKRFLKNERFEPWVRSRVEDYVE